MIKIGKTKTQNKEGVYTRKEGFVDFYRNLTDGSPIFPMLYNFFSCLCFVSFSRQS